VGMKRRSLLIAAFLLCVLVVPFLTHGQEKATPAERLVRWTDNLEDFGRAILHETDMEAARRIREGKVSGPLTVSLSFTVRELPRPPQDPSSVDVCWETCGSVTCYVGCSLPASVTNLTVFRCRDLHDRLLTTTDPEERRRIRREMNRVCGRLSVGTLLGGATP